MRVQNALILLASASLGCPVFAQSNPTVPTSPGVQSGPRQNNATRLAEAGLSGAVTTGMMVKDRSGETLGTVARVSPSNERHRYVVISSAVGNATPVPYSVASSAMAAGKIILDRAAFEQAPKIPPSQISRSPRNWQTKVDRYWLSRAR